MCWCVFRKRGGGWLESVRREFPNFSRWTAHFQLLKFKLWQTQTHQHERVKEHVCVGLRVEDACCSDFQLQPVWWWTLDLKEKRRKELFEKKHTKNGLENPKSKPAVNSWGDGLRRVRETGRTNERRDMGRERLTRGLLLRLGVLLTAVCVCVHVYLEMRWWGAPAALGLGRPTQVSRDWGQQSRTKRAPAEAEKQDKSVKRRISYVRTLKKDRKRDEDRGEPSPPCCPPPNSRRKVISHQLLSL